MSISEPMYENDVAGHLRALCQSGKSFALIYRPLSDNPDSILIVDGDIVRAPTLSALSLDEEPTFDESDNALQLSQLVLLPFNQLKEKGFACRDDNEPVIAMRIKRQMQFTVEQVIGAIADADSLAANTRFDLDDNAYQQVVSTIIDNEIRAGEGSNFVISRSIEGNIIDFSVNHALALFKRLLQSECGSYWTWMAFTGDRYFIGSSPEQHVLVDDSTVAMNPISGTLRYPAPEKMETALYQFLADEKERNELFMVVDEELKMMSHFCPSEIQVSGPELKMMSHVAHTEYFIEGRSTAPLKDILRDTLFAPTVTGSPIENACQVISRREVRGRGFYSGVVALTGVKEKKRYLDSAILIRTADISAQGEFRLTAGATIVRDSEPQREAEETRAKLSGLMDSFFGVYQPHLQSSSIRIQLPDVVEKKLTQLLKERNRQVSSFWLGIQTDKLISMPYKANIALIDMEDTFTGMIAYQLRKWGHQVTIIPWVQAKESGRILRNSIDADVLFIGPGPGDPTNTRLEKIAVARKLIERRLMEKKPLLGTCLGHQLICAELGLPVIRLPTPRQGSQYMITFGEQNYNVGFYNSFSAIHDHSEWYTERYQRHIELERLSTNEVIALYSEGVSSIQFHNESFLTENAFPIYEWLFNHSMESLKREISHVAE
ncbi:anthranilate synthase family protein [Dickeya undicola]|uniref:anthranilate synthase n=1 Tax=Dickeya undicola TaxID=1577887 RepID=A0A3N0FW12_9GAMM|nr:anthranilate synthase family protein [Dickeya undicola]RNM04256.1 phenazine-specific anthranilate synthase [Dickeya undicola]